VSDPGRGAIPDPIPDEDLAAITVGELRPINATIVLVAPDPAWPRIFGVEAAAIRAVLGERVRLLEHVGSTAVPGLPAKPIVDIVLEVVDSANEPAYIPAMEAAGYTLRIREPEWHEHRVLKGPNVNINLHVFSAGCPETRRMLAFRDHLRRDESDRSQYGRTKQELAARTWRYVQHYADAKSAVVSEIMSRALPDTGEQAGPAGPAADAGA
jgi:GrpB-like predicted nucleotidyltransferase (UPF0157 family)